MMNLDFSDFDRELKQVNSRLKAANIRVSIERKVYSLFLRATLPPSSNSDKTSPYQQHIALGVKANPNGLKRAEAEAKKLGAALDLKQFKWDEYSKPKKRVEQRTVAALIEGFRESYFEHRRKTPTSEQTFRQHYESYLKRLPQDRALTPNILLRVIKMTEPNSWTRQRICSVFQKFGTFAEVKIDWITKELRGTYSSLKSAPRDLPEDDVIVKWFQLIPNLNWRWVYAMIATFGLRPHEVFHLDTEELEKGGQILKVLDDTKTGYREVRPLHPEWIDQFGLRQKRLPNVKVTGQTNQKLGQTVGAAFRRYQVPFPAYHLRHRYAIRCIEYGIPVSLAARWMGHSVQMHTTIYQRWLLKSVEAEAFQRSIENPNRPQPPVFKPNREDETGDLDRAV